MSATGKDTNADTTPSFVAAVVVAAITVGAFTTTWVVLHRIKKYRRVFQPRVDLAPEAKRPHELPDSPVGFWKSVFGTADQEIIVANGVDAYFFVRFLKVFGLQMLLPYFLLTFAICIPVSAAAPTAGLSGLNILTFGNVSPFHQDRHVAHFLVAIILMFWTLYLLWREYNHFIEVRQAWMSSSQHLSLARSRTALITGLPEAFNSEAAIRELAGTVSGLVGGEKPAAPRESTNTAVGPTAAKDVETAAPAAGGVRQVWLARKVKDLEKVWQERDDECGRLEGGVAKLIKLAMKNDKKGKSPEKQGTYDAERSTSVEDKYVLAEKKPTWKQGLLGLIGRKMDLQSSPVYIAEHNHSLEEMRAKEWPQGNTAFIRFNTQADAHNFARLAPSTDKKLRLAAQTGIELVPEDVEWTNVGLNPYQRKVQTAISWALTIGLIIIWAIPVAFVGIVSNVDELCVQAPWLAWICRLPSAALGIIKGVLPPALLAVLFMLLPIVLRQFVKRQGEVRKSDIELKLFTRFWLFQVIHGFLIVTLASGLINALGNLGSTANSVPTLLASKLPGASIFFLTFILTATFASAAQNYARFVPLVMYELRGILGGNTPRKWFMTTFKMGSFAWATAFPPICLLICITIVYSVIQPIITLLCMLAFVLQYAAYKYTLYWCADQPDHLETGGLFYIKALRTVFVSLYLEGICLAGLFFLSTDQNGSRAKSGLACGAIMIVMIIFIAVFQTYIDWFSYKRQYLLFASTKAKPYQPALNAAAVTVEEETENAGPALGNTSGFHEQAFDHPALWKKQPVIWITNDPLGIGRYEAERITGENVEASTEYTGMDEKGKLEVPRGPPDEAWYGGYSN